MFEQERVIVRLQQRVLRDKAVRACFLSGSYGRRTDDSYSDLDVALVYVDSPERDEAWRKRREFARSVLPYVSAKSFDAVHVRPYFHIALYSNGAKVDYRFETIEALTPNPWDKDIRILKDDAEWAERFQEESRKLALPLPQMTTDELVGLDQRFWVMFWDVYRLLLRGDHDKPYTIYLELLHFTLPSLLHVLPTEHPAHQALLRTRFTHDTAATVEELRGLLEAYLLARAAVVRRLNLAFFADGGFELEIRKLVERNVN